MRLSRRAIVLTASTLALVAGLATGCGGGTDEAATTQTTTAAAATTTTAATATTPGDDQATTGARLFSTNCQSCHGPDGADGPVGPNLQTSPVAENLAQVMQQIRNGGGAMPPFSDILTDEEIDVVAHYVVEQIAPKQ
jgi:mono/diheme cytochrome c family protein